MLILLDLFVVMLASGAIIDVLFNGSIFENWREYINARADAYDPDATGEVSDGEADDPKPDYEPPGVQPIWMKLCDTWLPHWVVSLLSCWYCLSFHIPWVLIAWLWGMTYLLPEYQILWRLPVYSLAITRAGLLLNSMLPENRRYHRDEE